LLQEFLGFFSNSNEIKKITFFLRLVFRFLLRLRSLVSPFVNSELIVKKRVCTAHFVNLYMKQRRRDCARAKRASLTFFSCSLM
jgi:hypothetical protein